MSEANEVEARLGGEKKEVAMECPYCGAELEHEDVFGRILAHQDGYIAGDIYRCPKGMEQDGSCGSESFHVVGSFYTYRRGDDSLHEGYPC